MLLIRRTVVLLLMLPCLALGQETLPGQEPTPAEREHTAWIDSVLRAAQTIKPGMKRGELLRVFRSEGGLSTPRHQTYVYRGCPLIKVDLEFAPVADSQPGARGRSFVESMEDKIITISRPYLAWAIFD